MSYRFFFKKRPIFLWIWLITDNYFLNFIKVLEGLSLPNKSISTINLLTGFPEFQTISGGLH